MEFFFDVLRMLHVAAGTLALLSGPVAMANQDGKKLHRKAGLIYYWSMMVVVFSSVLLAIHIENWFLLMVGIFTFYSANTGYRVLRFKKPGVKPYAERIDWLILFVSAVAGVGLIVTGTMLLLKQQSFGIVPTVFGLIVSSGCVRDYKRFIHGPTDKMSWLYHHIGNMIGAYIATLTAFLVQNVRIEPNWIVWLAPTIVFVPFMRYTMNKFRKKGGIKLGM